MADNQSYLIKRGWKQDEASRRIWIDPLDNSCWSMSAAVSFQQSRDAAHLDTALAALELAQAALEAVTRIGGNLSDKGIEAVGGIHDAKSRALMVVIARAEARRGFRANTSRDEYGGEMSSRYRESTTKCDYCWHPDMPCRLIQLSHNHREWQSPIWCCDSCRIYLGRGLFRYAKHGKRGKR